MKLTAIFVCVCLLISPCQAACIMGGDTTETNGFSDYIRTAESHGIDSRTIEKTIQVLKANKIETVEQIRDDEFARGIHELSKSKRPAFTWDTDDTVAASFIGVAVATKSTFLLFDWLFWNNYFPLSGYYLNSVTGDYDMRITYTGPFLSKALEYDHVVNGIVSFVIFAGVVYFVGKHFYQLMESTQPIR
jgi:hypothetical protein